MMGLYLAFLVMMSKEILKKAQGKKNIYRGRIGDYRYYFRIFPESKSIEIVVFDHRSNIKKKTIQKL